MPGCELAARRRGHAEAMHACIAAGALRVATGADLNPIGPRLHAELAMVRRAGLSSLQVLWAATTGGRALNGLRRRDRTGARLDRR